MGGALPAHRVRVRGPRGGADVVHRGALRDIFRFGRVRRDEKPVAMPARGHRPRVAGDGRWGGDAVVVAAVIDECLGQAEDAEERDVGRGGLTFESRWLEKGRTFNKLTNTSVLSTRFNLMSSTCVQQEFNVMCSTCTVFNLRPYHDGQEHLQHGAHAEDPARLRQCTAYYTYSVSASEQCEWVSRDVVVVCLGGKIRGWQLGSGRCARAARAERKAARRFKGKRDGRLSFLQGVDACFNWASQFRARIRRRLFVPRSGGADVGQCIKEVQQFTESNGVETLAPGCPAFSFNTVQQK